MNYFSLFGIPPQYQIDTQMLALRFRELQRQYHPDRFICNSLEEQLLAVKQSAIINQAWQILQNPLSRAEYLISIYSPHLTKKQIIYNSAFLTEQLLLREKLNEIEQKQDKSQLKKFILEINKIFDQYSQQMRTEIDNKDWINAYNTVQKLQFLDKLLTYTDQLEETLLDL